MIRLLLAAIGTTSGVPSGLFVPLFIAGSLLGRSFAPFPRKYLGIHKFPDSCYAVVGAACVVSATTHTVAIIVITIELSADIAMIYPVMFAVCITYIISKSFTISIYYIILELKNLSFFPKLLEPHMY